jgi:hypothetical protein
MIAATGIMAVNSAIFERLAVGSPATRWRRRLRQRVLFLSESIAGGEGYKAVMEPTMRMLFALVSVALSNLLPPLRDACRLPASGFPYPAVLGRDIKGAAFDR